MGGRGLSENCGTRDGNLCEEGRRFVGGGSVEGCLWEGEERGRKFVQGRKEICGRGEWGGMFVGGGGKREEICARREGDLWEGEEREGGNLCEEGGRFVGGGNGEGYLWEGEEGRRVRDNS